MTYRSTGQSWALDTALSQGGGDALHPEAKGTLQQPGHDPMNFDPVFDLVKSGKSRPGPRQSLCGAPWRLARQPRTPVRSQGDTTDGSSDPARWLSRHLIISQLCEYPVMPGAPRRAGRIGLHRDRSCGLPLFPGTQGQPRGAARWTTPQVPTQRTEDSERRDI
jgi:hypothetical protein